MTRSALHRVEGQLTAEQRARLASADKSLLQQAHLYLSGDPGRRRSGALARDRIGLTPEHWWWYLDVLAQLPAGSA